MVLEHIDIYSMFLVEKQASCIHFKFIVYSQSIPAPEPPLLTLFPSLDILVDLHIIVLRYLFIYVA